MTYPRPGCRVVLGPHREGCTCPPCARHWRQVAEVSPVVAAHWAEIGGRPRARPWPAPPPCGGYSAVEAVDPRRIVLPSSRAATIPAEPTAIAARDPLLDARAELEQLPPLANDPDDPDRAGAIATIGPRYPLLAVDRRTAPIRVLVWYVFRLLWWRWFAPTESKKP